MSRRGIQPLSAASWNAGLAQQPGAFPRQNAIGGRTEIVDGNTPWWRRWWVWAALVLALVAAFLPVLR